MVMQILPGNSVEVIPIIIFAYLFHDAQNKETFLRQPNFWISCIFKGGKQKSHPVDTERPLTIACHMKNRLQKSVGKRKLTYNYLAFLVVSPAAALLAVSPAFVVSGVTGAGVGATVFVSAPVESPFLVSSEPLLQAVKTAATAKIAKNFFIVQCLFL
jgi:hypothetical protein